MLKRLGAALGLLCVVAVPLAFAAGLFPNFPIVGGASYCAGYNGITVPPTNCTTTVPAGPSALVGTETMPADTGLAQGRAPQTVLITPNTLANWEQAPVSATVNATSGAVSINLGASRFQNIALSSHAGGYAIGAPTNAVAGQTWTIKIAQDATGSRTVSWNSIYKWPSGTAPTLTTTASKVDVFNCRYDGTDNFCATTGLNYTP